MEQTYQNKSTHQHHINHAKNCDSGKQCDDKNFSLYQEIFRGAKMGEESIKALDHVEYGNELKEVVARHKRDYIDIAAAVQGKALECGVDLSPTSNFDKAMLWTGIFFDTLTDNTNSHIAELMTKGTHMGVISLLKLINQLGDSANTAYGDKLLKIYDNNLLELRAFL
ncbi:MAG: hypothetical protein R3Y23_07085 [Bacillota bacterium]